MKPPPQALHASAYLDAEDHTLSSLAEFFERSGLCGNWPIFFPWVFPVSFFLQPEPLLFLFND